jgi:hypothetical protein
MTTEQKIQNAIILSASLFGSVYIFSTTLKCMNANIIKNENNSLVINIFDGLTLIASSGFLIYVLRNR